VVNGFLPDFRFYCLAIKRKTEVKIFRLLTKV